MISLLVDLAKSPCFVNYAEQRVSCAAGTNRQMGKLVRSGARPDPACHSQHMEKNMRDLNVNELTLVSGGQDKKVLPKFIVTGKRGGGRFPVLPRGEFGPPADLSIGVDFNAEEFLIGFIEQSESIRTAAMVAVVEGREDSDNTISPEQLAEIEALREFAADSICDNGGSPFLCQLGRDIRDGDLR